MNEIPRWTPDEQLIPAFLAGRKPTMALSPADRAWVVAGMTLAGKKAEDIADQVGCSLRLVRKIWADPMAQLCAFYQLQTTTFTDEIRLARSELAVMVRNAMEIQAELDRTKTHLANLIGPKRFRCGHATDRYNVYECNGKRYCRTCHRQHSANSAARKKTPSTRAPSTVRGCGAAQSGQTNINGRSSS
jgi:hypothetical protein